MMMRVEDLLQHLIDTLADRAPQHAGLVVTQFDLDLPVEARIDRDASLLMTMPRGLLSTGFDPAVGRLRLHCEAS